LTDASGNGSVFGTDANRDEDISRNGSSGFDGNADSAEVAGLAPHLGRMQAWPSFAFPSWRGTAIQSLIRFVQKSLVSSKKLELNKLLD
jgi:hypothetical protein